MHDRPTVTIRALVLTGALAAHLAPIAGAQLGAGVTGVGRRPVPGDPPPPPPPLSYVIETNGLEEPGMEGGRTEFELADLNGDGDVDIVSIGDHGSPYVNTDEHGVMVWFGDGAGTWSLVQTGDFGYGGVAVGDVDGDGLLDVGYGMHHAYSGTDLGNQLMEVALGDGTGTSWTPWDDGLGLDGQSWGMFGTDFADVDGDGDLDVGSNAFGCCDGVHVYLNEGDGSWTPVFGFLGGNSSTHFHFADVNGDGWPDVVAANGTGTVFRGDGTGAFTAADGNLPVGWNDLHVGDVDGDGDDEVAYVAGDGRVEVWSWGPGDVWTSLSDGLPAGGPLDAVQLADMDGDGALDVLAAGGGIAGVWCGAGTGSWTLAWTGATPASADGPTVVALRAGDVDRNGRPDFVLMQDEPTGLFSAVNRIYAFREASRPADLALRVEEPGPGRTWHAGQVRFVDWVSAIPGSARGNVSLDLSTDGPGGPWTPLAGGLPDNGRHQLVVPAGAGGRDAWIRARLDAGGDVVTALGGPFTIEP